MWIFRTNHWTKNSTIALLLPGLFVKNLQSVEYSFGDWVRRRRKALDLTQQELANRVGCSVSLIFKIESDERRPSRQIAELLAEHLEISSDQQPLFLKIARQEKAVDGLVSLSLGEAPAQDRSAFVPPGARSELPIPLTPLVGRDHELRVILQQIQDPACRLLTLTGPGGVGKTRLVLEVAHRLQDVFEHGVHFVSLVSTSSSEFIVPAIAAALGLTLSSVHNPRGQLIHFLREKHLLLVLDNLEHLLAGIELLTELLENAPHLQILATSRERLSLRSEWVIEVQGLPIPASIDEKNIESNSAVALFLQRSRQSKIDFTLTADNIPALKRICELVEGLPLGLELAAAWIRTLSCSEIAREIERNIDFLAVNARDVPERHGSIRAVFDYSWNLLSESERRVMQRLSVFWGGFTRESAEKVAGASLFLLSGLVAKSLVRRNSAGRYDLHELIRQYAHEQLIHCDDLEDASNRHLEFFMKLVESTEPKLHGSEQIIWLDRLEQDLDNLRAALEWSLRYETAGNMSAAGAEAVLSALRLAGGLHLLWKRRSHWSEGRTWLERALAQSKALPGTLERAKALDAAALLAAEQTDTVPARQLAEENLKLSQELGDSNRIACAFNTLGMVLWKQKKYAEARADGEKGLALFRQLGIRFAVADSLHSLGHIAINQHDLAAAQSYLEEALSISRELDNKIALVEALGDLGLVAYLQNNYASAQTYLDESLILFREAGFVPGIESSLNRLGDLARCQGDYARAGQLYEESLSLFQDMDDKDEVASLLHNLGCVALQRGDQQRALRFFRDGLALQHEMGNQAGIAECLAGVASVLVIQGQAEEGARLLGAAEALRESVDAVLWPANRMEYDRILSQLRSSMDEVALRAAWTAGRDLSIQQAIRQASN